MADVSTMNHKDLIPCSCIVIDDGDETGSISCERKGGMKGTHKGTAGVTILVPGF